jgi:hypothetical protein
MVTEERERSSRTERPGVLLAKLGVVLLALCGAWACASIGRGGVEVQEWWTRRGPVVPHDSFPADCSLCHEGEGWQTIRADFEYDHEAETGVALQGAHERAECLRCHNDRGPAGIFAARGCVGCHGDVHQGKLGANCADCHGEDDWRPKEAIALHDRSGFPLVGSHAATPCWRCHVGASEGLFTGTDSACASCHQDDLARAQSPDHAAQGWVSGCDRCHISTTWAGQGFNHSTYPLLGTHRSVDCIDCHVGNVFAGTPRECVDCHLAEFQASSDPDHAAAGFPTTCELCHTPVSWAPAAFNHAGWPLTGSHTLAGCSDCHAGGVFAGTPSLCYDCHVDDYDGTDDPDHGLQGFPTTCEDCHNTTTWERANFDHSIWPLTGSHQLADCIDCHGGGVFEGTPNQCADCHQSEYDSSTDPHHQVAGFSLLCDSCHDTTAWQGATYGHSSWRLSGAHLGSACSNCHQSGVYDGLPSSCVDCHLQEFQSANDPDHVAAGFPQTCDTCHSTFTWRGATFDHSFPIDSGDHRRLDCNECHLQPRNFAIFSCTHCHEHNRADMADDHDRVRNYVWESNACYGCHPQGEE